MTLNKVYMEGDVKWIWPPDIFCKKDMFRKLHRFKTYIMINASQQGGYMEGVVKWIWPVDIFFGCLVVYMI